MPPHGGTESLREPLVCTEQSLGPGALESDHSREGGPPASGLTLQKFKWESNPPRRWVLAQVSPPEWWPLLIHPTATSPARGRMAAEAVVCAQGYTAFGRASLLPSGALGFTGECEAMRTVPRMHTQVGGPATCQEKNPTRSPGPQESQAHWAQVFLSGCSLRPTVVGHRPQATGPVLPGPTQRRGLGGWKMWKETSWAQSKEAHPVDKPLKYRGEMAIGPQGSGHQLCAP